jgi:hypothetical protein
VSGPDLGLVGPASYPATVQLSYPAPAAAGLGKGLLVSDWVPKRRGARQVREDAQ